MLSKSNLLLIGSVFIFFTTPAVFSQSTDGYRAAAWGVGTDIAIPGRY